METNDRPTTDQSIEVNGFIYQSKRNLENQQPKKINNKKEKGKTKQKTKQKR